MEERNLSSTSWQHELGTELTLTTPVTVCVGPQVPDIIAVGSPNSVGSLAPNAMPALVRTLPQRFAPALPPLIHWLFSEIGFSVLGNWVVYCPCVAAEAVDSRWLPSLVE